MQDDDETDEHDVEGADEDMVDLMLTCWGRFGR